jgi:hypothetical protein
LLGCLLMLGAAIWTKPACRDGYLASLFFADGWVCVPGYKPAEASEALKGRETTRPRDQQARRWCVLCPEAVRRRAIAENES